MIKKLLNGNKEWTKQVSKNKNLQTLHKGQKPKHIVFMCSDSRIVPELIFNSKPGEIFTHISIANMVPKEGKTKSASSVIEYGVNHLGSPNIIVCGHTHCGGISALSKIKTKEWNHLEKNIKDWVSHSEEAKQVLDNVLGKEIKKINNEKYEQMLVEASALFQAKNILEYNLIKKNPKIKVFAWVYDLKTGKIYHNYKTLKNAKILSKILKKFKLKKGNTGKVISLKK